MKKFAEDALNYVNTYSKPSELKITDMRFAHVESSSVHCILLKLYTNQGLVGMGEIRDGASATYAAMLKSRILGENPCDVDYIFRKIRQFAGPSRQGGGVSGIEIALWDLAGKAYQIPVYRMLGGKFRDSLRMYCDHGRTPPEERMDGTAQGMALKKRMDRFQMKMCKTILGIEDIQKLYPNEAILSGPPDYLAQIKREAENTTHRDSATGLAAVKDKPFLRKKEDFRYVSHPHTMLRITEHGLDRYEEYLSKIREAVGWQTPLAIDHLGHIGLEDACKLLQRLEKYHLMWVEDVLPWYLTKEYKILSRSTRTPLATGEDICFVENAQQLCQERGIAVIHPDVCSAGGILECKKIGDMAQKYGVSMSMHMCETPLAALATGHVGLATENFFAMEFNAPDDEYWEEMIQFQGGPLIQNGMFVVPERPGLGADDFNDEVIRQHLWPGYTTVWEETEQWDSERSSDRVWS